MPGGNVGGVLLVCGGGKRAGEGLAAKSYNFVLESKKRAALAVAVRAAAWGWCYWTWCRRVRHGVSVASPERACGPFLDKQIDLT